MTPKAPSTEVDGARRGTPGRSAAAAAALARCARLAAAAAAGAAATGPQHGQAEHFDGYFLRGVGHGRICHGSLLEGVRSKAYVASPHCMPSHQGASTAH
ncbi:hypothetical protein GCM10010274_17790 [Streptomyces lavendofoliae]|uniref:Uncharacterized protein n=1 Tax=Streptomyces lavendofoliae TaxID=67314 RepID=A0A918M2X6_9ACTN|nr:hypothetical protein GCM10010274_17790 [Streptomyces lavendofoliae]